MADHAPGAAEYALKAIASKGKPIDKERNWQDEELPSEIMKLVISEREKKSKFWEKHIDKAREEGENYRKDVN
ncbi:MAG: hypothetical protein SVK08_04580 [Halobacteriota archaeon]|nr:hypothetical protein [Halobacteriota archaeon]